MLAQQLRRACVRRPITPTTRHLTNNLRPITRCMPQTSSSPATLFSPLCQQHAVFIRQAHIRPTLDLRSIRDNVETIQANIVVRGSSSFASAHRVAELYEKSVSLEYEVAQVRKERNSISKKFSQAKSKEEKDVITAEGTALKTRLSHLEKDLSDLQALLETEALKIPNGTSPSTPIGPEGTGTVIRIIGEPRPHVTHDHLTFATKWSLIDVESGSKVVGSRFNFLQHELALLELALIQYAMQKLVRKGWTPVLPPDLIKSQYIAAAGFQPRDAVGTNSQVYQIADSDLSLVGTAEIPLVSMYADSSEELNLSKPIKHVAFGHAFRTEAGGHGLAIRGLYRVHQFSKVELFMISTPEQSEELFQEIIQIQQEMYHELGLCFRVLEIPSEDLGAPAYRKIDCEAWMPGRMGSDGKLGSWGEISSTSNCTDYQARRLGIKYRDPITHEKRFAHTLNGTAAAIPRLLISILEQHQSPDGSFVKIPAVLQPFMMGITQIPDQQLFPDRKEVTQTTSQESATTTATSATTKKAKK